MNLKLKNIFLWIAVFPASCLGALLGAGLWRWLHILTSKNYITADSWLNILFMEIMGNLILGMLFVYISYFISPNNKKIVAIVFACLALIVCGALLFIANFVTQNYLSNLSIISVIFGAVGTCLLIYNDKFNYEQ